ncbi:GlsB/YeaQ/YmgE family stress response membrane protein [Aliiroseovarius sp. S2029]|uniref:GlsB/YeaQ/YmgE family stress response membrane protein n=1 Tax=Aliiroseovarius sp. S2029 TaxID=2936988 RepID=UPI0020BF865C|nr:GlsB/YeaQ/YmgE family stress response membrane protein [Aliiroseovarius sp. S2029]MCK8485137.1 GlsB/YeaQ/YmgE family stress response membrane protein [Aliiroseovarius sp. S2029]
MPVIMLIIFGAAAGFLATRIMDLRTDVPTTIAIGVAGALIGGFVLRSIAMLGGMAFGFVGAVVGAIFLIWVWQWYSGRRK